jgi:hypothetical protein
MIRNERTNQKLTFKVIPSCACDFEQVDKWRSVVVWPMELYNSVSEVAFFVVCGSFRDIDDQVIVSVTFIQEVRHLAASYLDNQNLQSVCCCDRCFQTREMGKTLQSVGV